MMFGFPLLGKVTALAVTALVLDRLLRRASASVRDMMWTLTFAVLLLMPLSSLLAPRWDVAVGSPIEVVTTASYAAQSSPVVDWAPWVWLAGFAVVLARLGIAHARAALLVRRSRPVKPGLRESSAGTMPLTWGLFRPVILLPADAADWPEETRHAVLRHETAHVARRDGIRQLLCQITCALYWFHPLVWWAAARADGASESACDDAVLEQGAAPADYARHLVEVARRVRPLCSAAATTFCNRLEGRIMSILDTKRSRRALSRGAAVATGVLVGLLLAGISGMHVLADDDDVYRIGGGVSAPKLIYKVEPQYSEEARQKEFQGTVVLNIVVDQNGFPQDLIVVRPLGLGLDEKAIEAVKQWRFEPGMKDWKRVKVAATVEVNFRLP